MIRAMNHEAPLGENLFPLTGADPNAGGGLDSWSEERERDSVTPEVAGSSPVAPVRHSEPERANTRHVLARRALGGRHRESLEVRSRRKNGDQNGDQLPSSEPGWAR